MKQNKINWGIAVIFSLFVIFALSRGKVDKASKNNFLVGVKIYDHAGSFPELFEEWRLLGINTAFVSAALESNPEFRSLARKNGIATFIILPIFYNSEELEKRPDLYAITNTGAKASEDWVKFVCPTREDYRKARIEYVRNLVKACDPDGISLDFIRYFVFWEMVYPGRTLKSLPNTCFCSNCLEEFQKATNIKIPQEFFVTSDKAKWIIENHLQEWTEWKCQVILSMVKVLAEEARKIKPEIKINVHAVPWRRDDFGGAIKIIAGQDLAKIATYADYISPMCYHHMVKQNPEWIHSVVEDVARYVPQPILPSIQVKETYISATLSLSEFKDALVEALKPPSIGVVFWNWDALDKSPEKKEAVKTVLKSTG